MLKLQPSKCQFHPQSRIDLLCFESQCKQYAAICHECRFFDHQNHQAIQIRKILEEMIRDLQPNDETLKKIATIDSYYTQFKVYLHPSDGIKEQLNYFFIQLYKKIKRYHEITKEILNSSKINKKFISSLLSFNFYEKTQANCQKTNYLLFLEEMTQLLQTKLQEIRNAIKGKCRKQKLLQILNFVDDNKSTKKFKFSKKHKNQNIKLSQQDLTAVNQGINGNQLVLVEPIIKKKGIFGGNRSIRFKLNQTYSWTSVGVAFGDVVKKLDYTAQTVEAGNGLIAVSNSGYAFHHSDPTVHNSYLSWTFQTGDILKVTVKPSSKIITFEKQATQSSVDLPYTPEPSDQIYFCVILSYANESFSIIN